MPFTLRIMSNSTVANTRTTQDKTSFIWSVADLLRGSYRPAQYGSVILPFTVLRRLDCVLEATKPADIGAGTATTVNFTY